MVDALCLELRERKDYLDEKITTIYFGGGTPSLLNEKQLERLMSIVQKNYEIATDPEITLEANPEDLNKQSLSVFKKLGINRLSIGIQSFFDDDLLWMNRAHTGVDAVTTFYKARETGFNNISIDLIYAIPKSQTPRWGRNLEQVAELSPEHVSIYGLTIEENTVFGRWARQGKIKERPEEEAATEYLKTIKFLSAHGLFQYEVSNFSKPGYESRHNSSYWAGVPYLGIGPGAHSFNRVSRQWNVRNNANYIKALREGRDYYETERLTITQLMNEQMLTQLRTKNGIQVDEFKSRFEVDLLAEKQTVLDKLSKQNVLHCENQQIALTADGFLVADDVALKLFFDE